MTLTTEQLLGQLYIRPADQLDDLLLQVRQEDVDDLLNRSRPEKIFPQVYLALKRQFAISQDHHDFYDKYQRVRQEVLRVLKVLEDQSEGFARYEYLLLKGPGIESYYPAGRQRFFFDIDMCVPSADDFWKIGQVFLDHELEQSTTMTLFQSTETAELLGCARFDSLNPEDDFYGVEVQVGTFPLSSTTYIPWQRFVRKRTTIEIEGVTIPVPDREGNLIVFLGELIDRKRLPIRDLFDMLYILEGAEDRIDLAYVAEQVRTFELHYSLSVVLEALERLGMETPPLLRRLVELSELPSDYRFRSFARDHVWPYLRTHTRRPMKNMLFYWLREQSNVWNDQDRMLYWLKESDQRFSAKHFFENGTYVYFVKIDSERSPWQWTQYGSHDVVLTPIGSYVASMHALNSDEELDEIEAFLNRSGRQEVASGLKT